MARQRRGARIWSPSLILRQRAITQGFLGGRPGWQIVGAVIFGRRILRKVMGDVPEVVANERLEPGQSVQIIAIPAPTRRERREERQERRAARRRR